MRTVKGYIHIQAPVHHVRTLAGSGSSEWLAPRSGLLGSTRLERWDATELDSGGTRFTLQMAFGSRLAFLDSLVGEQLHESVAQSLTRLKDLAEQPGAY